MQSRSFRSLLKQFFSGNNVSYSEFAYLDATFNMADNIAEKLIIEVKKKPPSLDRIRFVFTNVLFDDRHNVSKLIFPHTNINETCLQKATALAARCLNLPIPVVFEEFRRPISFYLCFFSTFSQCTVVAGHQHPLSWSAQRVLHISFISVDAHIAIIVTVMVTVVVLGVD